MRCLHVTP